MLGTCILVKCGVRTKLSGHFTPARSTLLGGEGGDIANLEAVRATLTGVGLYLTRPAERRAPGRVSAADSRPTPFDSW